MDDDTSFETARATRRQSLTALGGLLAGVAAAGAEVRSARAAGAAPAAGASVAAQCVLTPEMTEGPYYIADEAVRRNIRQGKRGTPLELRLRVVDAESCNALRGAAVDIWHADAGGVYSGFGTGASSRTFLRGIQRTDSHGLAIFGTVYPGWYPGRTVHIHVKVHLGSTVVHTGQLFFRDTLTDAVYRSPPYDARPSRDTRNAQDAIFAAGGRRSMLAVARHGSGYVGSIAMGVRRS